MTAAEALFAQRIAHRLTQEQVSEKIGCSRAAVAAYEQGRRRPRDDVKARFAALYGTTVQELFYSDEVNPPIS